MYYSLLIFSNREPRTIERAVLACIEAGRALSGGFEVLVVAPDGQTKLIIEGISVHESLVRFVQDAGRGKPAAINVALEQVRGGIVIFTDGDVYMEPRALHELVAPFARQDVGAVSGHPVADNDRATKFGFWAHALTDAGAHALRVARVRADLPIEASGYLMAIRRDLLSPLPEDTLGDDQVISFQVLEKGFRIAYAPDAIVHVLYADHLRDWIKQKTRSLAGYYQHYALHQQTMRSVGGESGGAMRVWQYARGFREKWWVLQLFVARAYVWLRAWWLIKIRRKSFSHMWRRVESTK